MKRLITTLLFAFFLLALPFSSSAGNPEMTSYTDWYQAKQGYWFGRIDGKSWWYRFNEDNSVSRSADARNWEAAEPVVGKDVMGVVIRLTADEVVTGEDKLLAWIPILTREWDKENGLNYEVSYAPLIWSLERPHLYHVVLP